MGVYIKGMEMPKKGSWINLRVFPDGQCFIYSWCGNDFDFMEHLTAVPVPEHGRLIDADEFYEALTMDDRVSIIEAIHVKSILSEVSTIIPASKEETK